MASPPQELTPGAKIPQTKVGSQLICPVCLSEPLPLLDRLQHKLAFLQQQCEEKQQLSLSLQSELQIYESLCGNPKTGLKGMRTLCPFSVKPRVEALLTQQIKPGYP